MDVFNLRPRRPKYELFSCDEYWTFELVLDVTLAKIHEEVQYSSQVSLFVTSCGLIVERKYMRCTFLVKLYTSHQKHKFSPRDFC